MVFSKILSTAILSLLTEGANSLDARTVGADGALHLVNPFWGTEPSLKGGASIPSGGMASSAKLLATAAGISASGKTSVVQSSPTSSLLTPLNTPSQSKPAHSALVSAFSKQLPSQTSLASSIDPTPIPGQPSTSSTIDIFADPAMLATTMTGSEGIATYSRQTYSDLMSLTGTTTITTSADGTNLAGIVGPTEFPVIVGPGGVHWTPICSGLLCPAGGPKIPPCIGILCPAKGGDDSTSDTSGGGETDGGGYEDGEPDDEDSDDDVSSTTQSSRKTTEQQTTTAPPSTTMATTTSSSNTTKSSMPSACRLISVPPEQDPENGWTMASNLTTVPTTTASACSLISVPPEQDPENSWTEMTSSTLPAMSGTLVSMVSNVRSAMSSEASVTGLSLGSSTNAEAVPSPSVTAIPSISSGFDTGEVPVSGTQSSNRCRLATITGTISPDIGAVNTYCMCGDGTQAGIKPTTMSRVVYDLCLDSYPQPFVSTLTTLPPLPFTTSEPPSEPPVVITSATPAYVTGRCNVHVRQGLGEQLGESDVYLQITMTDAAGVQVGDSQDSVDWAGPLEADGVLPYPLAVTPIEDKPEKRDNLAERVGGAIPAGRPLHEDGPVQFGYGDQSWDTTSSQCSVGGWDNGSGKDIFWGLFTNDAKIPNRQIDCKFDC